MDTSNHTMQALFKQLGLSNNEISIENFIHNNHLPWEIPLNDQAPTRRPTSHSLGGLQRDWVSR